MNPELDSLVANAAKTPIRPKRPKRSRAKRVAPTKIADAKRTAVELVDAYLSDESQKQTRLAKKLNKGEVSARVIYEAFSEFEKAVGGRTALVKLLQHCPDNSPAASAVRALCADPDFLAITKSGASTSYALDVLANRHKLPFNALVRAFKDSTTASLAVQALTKVAKSTTKVAEQIAEDAQNRFVTCRVCDGAGRVPRISEGEFVKDSDGEPITQVCWECKGKGRLYRKHDIQNRKLLLQISGVLEEKPMIEQNFGDQRSLNFNFGPDGGGFEQVSQALDRILARPSGSEPPIEAEIVENAEIEEESPV